MPDFESFDLRGQVAEVTRETFDTMLSLEVSLSEEGPEAPPGDKRLVGSLTFAGAVAGLVNIQVAEAFAYRMAAGMLGADPAEVSSLGEVKDMLAEVTNIIGGNLKSALNDAGFPCVISTPAITYGSDFSIRSLELDRFERFVFTHHQDVVLVEVGLKQRAGGAESPAPGLEAGKLPTADLARIEAIDYAAKITETMIEVFDTMLSMDIEPAPEPPPFPEGQRHTASVCFGGEATGILSIAVSDAFSRQMAAGMLGMQPEEIEGLEEIVDMLGELSNIVGGGIKSVLTDAGLACALSTPAFTTGTDFEIEALNLARYERLAFRHGEHGVLVEMGVKISDLAVAAQAAEPTAAGEPDGGLAAPTAAEDARAPEEAIAEDAAAADDGAAGPPAGDAIGGDPQAGEADPAVLAAAEDFDLELLMDIPLEITVELGRARVRIQDLLDYEPGSVVKLARLEGEPVDILVNDTLIARGEVVVRNEKYGIRITEITSRMDRIRSLR